MASDATVHADDLKRAIERAYGVFEKYASGLPMEYCADCVTKADAELLFSNPLRELNSHDLHKYGFKAISTFGTVDDFKHFLPRILELIAHEVQWGINRQVVTGKLTYNNWTSWPEDEKSTISGFFDTWWRFSLTNSPAALPDPGERISVFGTVFDDLSPFFEFWQSILYSNKQAATQFAHLVNDAVFGLTTGECGVFLWRESERQSSLIRAWLVDPEKAKYAREISNSSGHPAFGLIELPILELYQSVCRGDSVQ